MLFYMQQSCTSTFTDISKQQAAPIACSGRKGNSILDHYVAAMAACARMRRLTSRPACHKMPNQQDDLVWIGKRSRSFMTVDDCLHDRAHLSTRPTVIRSLGLPEHLDPKHNADVHHTWMITAFGSHVCLILMVDFCIERQ